MADEHATTDEQHARDTVIRAAFAWQSTHRPLIGGTAVERFYYEQQGADADRSLSQAVDALRGAGDSIYANTPETVRSCP